MTDQPEVKAGSTFTVEVVPGQTIEDIRKDARERFGRDVHIQAKIGPIEQRGNGIGCPLEAVDDPFLQGNFNRWPQTPGGYLLVGYFK